MSSNVANLLAEDSPLLQRARSQALQQSNSRGLLNSSFANENALGAVIDRAMPLAQYDASARTGVNNQNLANQQQTNTFNAGQTQQNNQFNANNANNTNQFNNQQAQQNNQFNASNQQQTNLNNAETQNQVNQFNSQQNQQNNQFNANNQQDVNKFNAQNQNQNSQFNAAEQNKNNIFNANEQNVIIKQLMDQSNKLQLADIEASYKNIWQSEASAGSMYQQSVRKLANFTNSD